MKQGTTTSFEDAITAAAQRLVAVRHEATGSFITTPLMYPSGGAVVVWIDRSSPHFVVSDFAFGARECEIMGADRRQYQKYAGPVAEASGVTLLSDGSFQALVTEGQLEGAIKTIANCSNEVCSRFANRVHQRQRADVKTVLLSKLVRMYGPRVVGREVEFKGASNTPWQIDAVVTSSSGIALFETVTPWFPSVTSTLAKFGDIKLLPSPPIRTSVLSSEDGFGSWVTALAQAGHVVQATATDATFSRLITLQ